jgi:Mg2+/citrate symporter
MKNLNVIFNGVAVAMGVAIIVLNIVNPLSPVGATTLLGIGIAALGIANLQKA